MFRFLFKWSLQITGVSMVTYHSLAPQKRADVDGAAMSLLHSSRASIALFRSIFDYYHELRPYEYNSEAYHQKRSEVHNRVANRIVELSEKNQGIYLKLGQYLGNLERVIPEQFTEVLKVLEDSGPAIPYDDIKVVIEQDLLLKPRELFDKFDKKPLTATSLGQVHKAVLRENNKEVAVKIQFPFIRNQSQWDLWALGHIATFCHYLLLKNQSVQIDLPNLFETWKQSLMEELDFQREIANAEYARKIFRSNSHIYVPRIYPQYSSDRIIAMEFINGIKITQAEELAQAGFSSKTIAKTLVSAFTDMIFKHHFVYHDTNPENILVRKAPRGTNPKEDYQLVFMSHGLYRSVTSEFIRDFSNLWISLVKSDKKNVAKCAHNLNIRKHLQYLPILFLHRTINSSKKLGDSITKQQKEQIREREKKNFDGANNILQDLPPDLVFIIRAFNLIAAHNMTLGGTHRERIFKLTKSCLWNTSNQSALRYTCSLLTLTLRIWIMEHFYGLYRVMFGTLA